VDSKAPHTDPQDRRLKRIARQKGFTCPDCGSSEPVLKEGGELKDLPDGSLEVPVRCEACEGASEMALVLSPEEAEALGFHSLGGGPEAP
jgi:ssDNA-binding Zn-finger/Zn-ribbon topoisomerase 1